VVLGVEEELNGVTDICTDVARIVDQLTAGPDLDRISRSGTSGGRTRGGVGRLRCGSILISNGRESESLSHCHSNICRVVDWQAGGIWSGVILG